MTRTVTVHNRTGMIVASQKVFTLDVIAKMVVNHRVRDGNRVSIRPELSRFERAKIETMIERLLDR